MIHPMSRARRARKWVSIALTLMFALVFLPPPPAALRVAAQEPQIPVIAPGSAYRLTTLITDVPGLAPVLDPLLVNPWGLSLSASSPFWVSNNGNRSSLIIRSA